MKNLNLFCIIALMTAIFGFKVNAQVAITNDAGFTTPQSILHTHINAATGSVFQLTNTSSGFASNAVGFGLTVNTNDWTIRNYQAGSLSFHTTNLQRAIILSTGQFGINMTPTMQLDVTSATTTAGESAIRGASTGAGVALYGVRGTVASTTTDAAGVYGSTGGGQTYGVLGITTSTTGNASGIRGFAQGATGATNGVWGEAASSTGSGVYGQATHIDGDGVFAYNSAASSTGTGTGLYAQSAQGGGAAGWAVNTHIDGDGFYGINNTAANTGTGCGVYGITAQSGGGISVAGTFGVCSNTTGGAGVGGWFGSASPSIFSKSGVSGICDAVIAGGFGVIGACDNATGKGVQGQNTSAGANAGFGGYFTCNQTGGAGVAGSLGSSTYFAGAGVSGVAASTVADGIGVAGGCDNATGIGVYGEGSKWAGYFYGNVTMGASTASVNRWWGLFKAGSTSDSHQIVPNAADYSYVGTSALYFYCSYVNNLRYKNAATFDTYDDIELINSIKGDTVWDPLLNHHIMRIKPESLPLCVTNYEERLRGETNNIFIDAGNMSGLLLGASKQINNESRERDERLTARSEIIADMIGVDFSNLSETAEIKIFEFGTAVIKSNETWVAFPEEFTAKLKNEVPVITITSMGANNIYIVEKNNLGFKVATLDNKSAISFDWNAFAKVKADIRTQETNHIDDVFYRKPIKVTGDYPVYEHPPAIKDSETQEKLPEPDPAMLPSPATAIELEPQIHRANALPERKMIDIENKIQKMEKLKEINKEQKKMEPMEIDKE